MLGPIDIEKYLATGKIEHVPRRDQHTQARKAGINFGTDHRSEKTDTQETQISFLQK